MYFKTFLSFCFLTQTLIIPASTEEISVMEENIPWTGLMRIKALESIDKMLSLAFDLKTRSYKLHYPLRENTFINAANELIEFSNTFGFFSPNRPLLGRVTEEIEDIELTRKLLAAVHTQLSSPIERNIATGEILSKILAYRDLKEGMKFSLSVINARGSSRLVEYIIDHVFDLWHGMPAYGLMPTEAGEAAPILLFRGTDLSMGTTRSWASVISDLNTSGPGLQVFRNAQVELHEWLERAAFYGVKARAMGYSLGGVLTAYTTIFEANLMNRKPRQTSMSFNPPGVSHAIWELWNDMTDKVRAPLSVFVVRGDLVSKIGLLFGDVVEFSIDEHLKPISAHVLFVTGQPTYRFYPVNVDEENESR
jgi:hypothetical protein